MKRKFSQLGLAVLCSSLLGSLSCKEDDDGGPAVEGALGRNRPPPRGSVFIDRAGRVAITAALIETFNTEEGFDRNQVLAGYNSVPTGNPLFLGTMQASLGVLDALDGQCGNQLLADNDGDSGRYLPLAQTLLDDRIYLNRSRAGSVYLGVEGVAIEALEPADGAGGGRAPGDDTVERSYSVLAAGVLDGIDDGLTEDDAQHTPSTFPFLAAP